jgi:hypothetical protein
VTITRLDDYPVHQTPEPLAVPASSDPNVYDRYWFNAFPADGSWYLGVAFGRYPHRGVIDGAVSVSTDGRQHSAFVSGRAPAEPTDTHVGPMRIEVVEPMRTLRLTLDDNDSGLACDLTFTARTEPIEEQRQTLRSGSRVVMDATRFAQFGWWEGVVATPDGELQCEPSDVRATKDRSWGIRRVGERAPIGAPPAAAPQFSFLWAPVHWDDRCTHVCLFEDGAGRPWVADGAVATAAAGVGGAEAAADVAGVEHATGVARRVDYVPGTRRAAGAALTLERPGEAAMEIDLEPLLLFQMKGLGYGHPQWGHGTWHGDLAVGAESIVLDDLDPLALENLHIQQLVRARSGGATGMGALEQLCIGVHEPSGFTGLNDGAPG